MLARQFLAILMAEWNEWQEGRASFRAENRQRGTADVRNPPAPAGFFTQEGLYGDGGQPRVVVTTRHQHALFHAPLQLTLESIPVADETPSGVVTRQLLFHQRHNVLTGSVRVTSGAGALQAMLFTFGLVAAEPFAHKPPGLRYQLVHLQRLQVLLLTLLILPFHTAAPRGHNGHVRDVERGEQCRREGDIGRDIAANLRVILGLIGNQPQLRHKRQRPRGAGDGQIAAFRLGGETALDGQIGDGALNAVGQRVIVETQPLEQGIDGPAAQQWRHPVTFTQRAQERHMDGKVKTGREAFGFRHQLTTERQCLFAFTRRECRVRVFDLTVMGEQGLGVSHTFPHLCCTEGALSTEGIAVF